MMRPSFRTALRYAVDGFNEDELFTHAAAIAFYSALSIAPLVLLVLWILSLLGPQWQQQIDATLSNIMGDKAAASLIAVVNSAKSRPTLGSIAGIVSVGITLFSASVVFSQLQTTLNRIWRIEAVEHGAISNWIKARARALGLLLGIAFLLIVSFAVSALIHLLTGDNTTAWSVTEYLVSVLVFMAAFAAMYRILPDTEIAWRDAYWGGLLTTLLFVLGKFTIELYIQHARIGGAYGPAGGLVVMLTWVYYASFVVLLGAELTHGIAKSRATLAR